MRQPNILIEYRFLMFLISTPGRAPFLQLRMTIEAGPTISCKPEVLSVESTHLYSNGLIVVSENRSITFRSCCSAVLFASEKSLHLPDNGNSLGKTIKIV